VVGAPFLLTAVIYGAWLVTDRAVQIAGFDRAQLGWAILAPMALALPTVVAWSARRLGPHLGRLLRLGVAAMAAGLIVAPVVIDYRGRCADVGLPMPVSSLATLALLIGATVLVAAFVAEWAWGTARGRVAMVRALVAGALAEAVGFVVVAMSLMYLLYGACIVRPTIAP
jgi:hypothetical protein